MRVASPAVRGQANRARVLCPRLDVARDPAAAKAIGPGVVAQGSKVRYERRRRDILRSAVAEMNARGVRGTTLGSVAARLNMAAPALSYYFKSKEELAVAAFLEAIGCHQQMISAAEKAVDGERVAVFLASYLEHHRAIALGAAEPVVAFNDVRALNSGAVNAAYVEMFRRARALLPGAEAAPGAERNAAGHLLISQILWVTAWLKWFEPHDYGRAGQRMTDILQDGLVRSAAAAPVAEPLSLFEEERSVEPPALELFLRAATQLINAEGYHGASVAKISAKLNLTKGSFYHHIPTKDALVVACFERTFRIIWRAIEAAEQGDRSGAEVMTSVIGALVGHQFAGASPLLSSSALSTLPERIRTGLLEKLDRITHRYAMIISEGIADGSIRPVDVNIASYLITGAVNGAAELPFWTRGLTPEAAKAIYLRLIFRGFDAALAPGGPTSRPSACQP